MYPTLEAALRYGARGFRVLPIKPGTKIPDLRHWPEEASSDAATIERQFAASLGRAGRGRPNVGIVTGGTLAVLDIDPSHGGQTPSWAKADTLTAKTPSGGYHLYFATQGGVPNSVGRLAPGVDVRGERGQVVAPPSTVEAGAYEWVQMRPIARMSSFALTPEDMRVDFAGRSVAGFQHRDDVPTGQRNNYLTSLAGWLFANGEDAADVLHELSLECLRLDFSPRDGEIAQITRSVARYHR